MRISDWSSDVCSSDLAQIGKFADLDRRAERARAQFELQPFIGIARDRLDEADDREIERRERNRIGEGNAHQRSEEHTSELQSLMRISYAVFCLKKNNKQKI